MDKFNHSTYPLRIIALEAIQGSDGNIDDAVQRFKYLLTCDYPWVEAAIRQAIVNVDAELKAAQVQAH
jgi:hypothetical protein